MLRQLLQLFPRPLFQLMRSHQAIESCLTNLLDESGFVFADVAREIRIAMLTLEVAVGFVVAGFFACSNRPVVTRIHLGASVAATADAAVTHIAGADEFVEG